MTGLLASQVPELLLQPRELGCRCLGRCPAWQSLSAGGIQLGLDFQGQTPEKGS